MPKSMSQNTGTTNNVEKRLNKANLAVGSAILVSTDTNDDVLLRPLEWTAAPHDVYVRP